MVIMDQKTRKMNMKKTTDFIFKAMKDMWLVVIISRKAKKHTNSNSSNKICQKCRPQTQTNITKNLRSTTRRIKVEKGSKEEKKLLNQVS